MPPPTTLNRALMPSTGSPPAVGHQSTRVCIGAEPTDGRHRAEGRGPLPMVEGTVDRPPCSPIPLAEATFVPATLPRDGVLALWSPAGDHRRRRLRAGAWSCPARPARGATYVPVRLGPVARGARRPASSYPPSQPVRPSLRAWSAVTRIAVELDCPRAGCSRPHLDGRGRLAAGSPRPRGPGAPRQQLSAALPPEAHARARRPASAAGGLPRPRRRRPLRRRRRPASPGAAAPPEWLGHDPFAAMPATDLHASEPWFRSLGGRPDEAMVAMRLEPPTEEHGRFAGVIAAAEPAGSQPRGRRLRPVVGTRGRARALRGRRVGPPARPAPSGEGVAADRPVARPAPAHLAGPAGRGRRRADGAGRRGPRRRRRPRPLAGCRSWRPSR